MRKSLTLFLVFTFAAGLSFAEVKKETDSFWDLIQKKIEKITPKKNARVTTAVGGVRGAKNSSSEGLYWKGEEVELEVSEDELADFNQALGYAVKQENQKAIELFETFLEKYHQSSLRQDALTAVENLKKHN